MLGWPTKPRRVLTSLTGLALAAATWAAPAVAGDPGAASHAASGIRNVPDRYEALVVHWTNVKRRRHGLRPLRPLPCPDSYAESWARHLARTGRFYHQDASRLLSCNGTRLAGENLARGTMTPRQTVNAWMRSPGHRHNILRPRYTHLGVGSVRALAEGGRVYTAQTFIGR